MQACTRKLLFAHRSSREENKAMSCHLPLLISGLWPALRLHTHTYVSSHVSRSENALCSVGRTSRTVLLPTSVTGSDANGMMKHSSRMRSFSWS
jgi:hypothetical protein